MSKEFTKKLDQIGETLEGVDVGNAYLLGRQKRVLDIVGSLALLIPTIPVTLLASAAIKATERGPSIIALERVGLGGDLFRQHKLRSMRAGEEKKPHNGGFKAPKDDRITKIGSFLRKTSADEGPQVFDVLRGDMSLVGRRATPIEQLDLFKQAALPDPERGLTAEQNYQFYLENGVYVMKPGLTGLEQINGRGRLYQSSEGLRKIMDLTVEYAETACLELDLKIIAKTIPAVLTGDGAH